MTHLHFSSQCCLLLPHQRCFHSRCCLSFGLPAFSFCLFNLFFAVLSSASVSLSFSFSWNAKFASSLCLRCESTSSLSCSFLLIFLYKWNSPDPAPAELVAPDVFPKFSRCGGIKVVW